MTASGGWVFTARARRDFRRIDAPVQRRITDALDRLVADPPVGDVIKLTGTDHEFAEPDANGVDAEGGRLA